MKLIKYLITAFIVLSLLIACVDPNYPPIFYTLANEYDITDERGLEDDAGVVEIVAAEGNYFALTSKLIYRTGSGNWDPDMDNRKVEYNFVPTPADLGNDAICLNIEVEPGAPDTLFAGFFEFGSPDTGGLYYTTGAADPANITWTRVTPTAIDDTQIAWIKLLETTGELFVSTKNTTTDDYALYYSNDPTNSASYAGAGFQVGDDPISSLSYIDVAYDGNTYFVIIGPYLYSGALGNLALKVDTDDPQAVGGRNLTGLLGIPGATDRLYLTGIAKDQDSGTSDDSSNLWMTEDSGSTWTRKRILEDPTDSDSDIVGLTTFVDLTATSPYILIGSVGFGYYELDTGDVTAAAIGRPAPADIGDLDEAAINSFYPNTITDPTIVFACTSRSGLWRAEWDVLKSKWLWNRE